MRRAGATAVALVILLALDAIWLTTALPMYKALVSSVQGGLPMRVRYEGAAVAYILMVITFIFLIAPAVETQVARKNFQEKLWAALRWGGLTGLCVYGVYNATNYAILSGYAATPAIVDTLWGGTLMTLATLAYLLLR